LVEEQACTTRVHLLDLADPLVHDAPRETGDTHWNEEANALIAGILLHIVRTECDQLSQE